MSFIKKDYDNKNQINANINKVEVDQLQLERQGKLDKFDATLPGAPMRETQGTMSATKQAFKSLLSFNPLKQLSCAKNLQGVFCKSTTNKTNEMISKTISDINNSDNKLGGKSKSKTYYSTDNLRTIINKELLNVNKSKPSDKNIKKFDEMLCLVNSTLKPTLGSLSSDQLVTGSILSATRTAAVSIAYSDMKRVGDNKDVKIHEKMLNDRTGKLGDPGLKLSYLQFFVENPPPQHPELKEIATKMQKDILEKEIEKIIPNNVTLAGAEKIPSDKKYDKFIKVTDDIHDILNCPDHSPKFYNKIFQHQLKTLALSDELKTFFSERCQKIGAFEFKK
jgi:hypothetical protein